MGKDMESRGHGDKEAGGVIVHPLRKRIPAVVWGKGQFSSVQSLSRV